MEDKIKKRLKAIGGDNLRIKESSKSIQKRHKINFVEIITQFKEIFIKSNNKMNKNAVKKNATAYPIIIQ